MKANNVKRTVPFLLAALFGLVGCELLVDFDRTKIPVETADSGPTPDAAVDVVTDAAADTAPDTSADAADAADALDAGDAADAADAEDADGV